MGLLGILFTFSTYGTHLHGAPAGSVVRWQRSWGAPRFDANGAWERRAGQRMAELPFVLDSEDREVVLGSVMATATDRSWVLYCAHVRTNHVHVVLQPNGDANRALAYLKARATRALKLRYSRRSRFWTKHGSTRYLWQRAGLSAAIDYVVNRQGEAMSVYRAES